jgi:hypothetical protein
MRGAVTQDESMHRYKQASQSILNRRFSACACSRITAQGVTCDALLLVYGSFCCRYSMRMSKRRSRMRRTSSGKKLALTERDFALFRVLAEYRYLRSTYLYAFAKGASETRFKERLGDLFHEGFIDRPEKQWDSMDARSTPVVYELDEPARRALAERGHPEVNARTFLGPTAHRQFVHSRLICECLASIELATREHTNLRFIAWSEILSRAPASTRSSQIPFRVPFESSAVIPDGLFGLEYQTNSGKAYRFFALEVDRGTMPISRTDGTKTSYLAKLAGYREIMDRRLHKQHWGISSLFVLTVTTSPERPAGMLRAYGERGASPMFLFKAAEPKTLTAPKPRLLSEPWERAGLSALSISESG